MDRDKKKEKLGDIMDRYQQDEQDKRITKPQFVEDEGPVQPQREVTRPIQVEQPAGAQYAQYRQNEEDDPNHYSYGDDYKKFDVLDRGHRAAMSGIPRSKLITDIGHDLKTSIKNEVSKIRSAINVQQVDFKD